MLRSAIILFSSVALAAGGDCDADLRNATIKVNETHTECVGDMDALSHTMAAERALVETAHAEWQKRLAAEAAAQKAVDEGAADGSDHHRAAACRKADWH